MKILQDLQSSFLTGLQNLPKKCWMLVLLQGHLLAVLIQRVNCDVVILQSGRIRVDEDIDDTEGKTQEEVDEMIKEKEAKANAQILEMVSMT